MEDIVTHNIGYIVRGGARTLEGKFIRLDNHLVFLTHDDKGNYQYWNTRSIYPSPIKSVNGIGSDGEYTKRTTVFNMNRAKRSNAVVICEGVPDALTIGEQGVATFGKQITDEQINVILEDLPSEIPIFIMLDNDAVDQVAKVGERLYKRHKNTYIVLNPQSADANDMGREQSWDVIINTSVRADPIGIAQLLVTLKG